MSQPDDATHQRIAFSLTQDKDGYPPAHWERLWATCVAEDLYRIDNIPFFAKGVSCEDLVLANEENGQQVFRRVVVPSANSVLRIFVLGDGRVQELRDQFMHLGCDSELSHISGLFALNVPAERSFNELWEFIQAGIDGGMWECEIASMRHPHQVIR